MPTPSTPDRLSAFSTSPWRPVVACTVATVVGLVLAPLVIVAPPPASGPLGLSDSQSALPAASPVAPLELDRSQIAMVTLPVPAAPLRLQGALQEAAEVEGEAAISGEVAKQDVQVGQMVHQGDPVIELSVGPTTRVAPRQRRAQDVAEQAQLAAMQGQDTLAKKIADAQLRLAAAQARVAAARDRVVATRALLARAGAGNGFPGDSDNTSPATAEPRTRVGAGRSTGQNKGRLNAEAQAAAVRLQDAQNQLDACRKLALQADQDLKTATANVNSVEDRFDRGNASGSDVEDARAAAVAAQTKAADAAKAAFTARQEVGDLTKKATRAQEKLTSGAGESANFEADRPAAAPQPISKPTNPTSESTLDAAIAKAKAALEESRAATADAAAIAAEIGGYQRKVDQSQEKLTRTSQHLSTAQQQLMDAVPPPKFVVVTAPAEGTVKWLSPLARDARPGTPLFGLAPTSQYSTRLAVPTAEWRSLAPGSVMNGSVSEPGPSSLISAPPAVNSGRASVPRPGKVPVGARSQRIPAAVMVKVISITPLPHGVGAFVEASVDLLAPGVPPVALRNGLPVIAHFEAPQVYASGSSVSIPAAAVYSADGSTSIAAVVPAPGGKLVLEWKKVKLLGPSEGKNVCIQGVPFGTRYFKSPGSLPARFLRSAHSVASSEWTVKLYQGL